MVLKRGFTMVELLIVMAIILIMVVIVVGLIDPVNLSDRGYDARRKKDVKRIGVAFEEYFNDKGCFPTVGTDPGEYDFDNMDCGSNGFAPWIGSWICDPRGTQYKIIVEDSGCPLWYKVYARLGNRSDRDIPKDWYNLDVYFFGDGSLGVDNYNYGTSSTNVNWYDKMLDPSCNYNEYNHALDNCFSRPPGPVWDGACNRAMIDAFTQGCSGSNCYAIENCGDMCQVSCCGGGCN